MNRSIQIKRHLPYKPDLVWRAITDSKLLGRWFMENDLELQPGFEFTFRKPPQKGWDGITYCKVTTIETCKRIAYTYRGTATGEKTLACAGVQSDLAQNSVKGIFTALDTVLSFTLVPYANGTDLHLTHSGYNGLKSVIVSLVMEMGWKKLLKKLSALLKKMDKEKIVLQN